MQDYKRAIIIGGKQTYGKGTVQNVFPLNRMVRGNTNGDLGALRYTTQKYYRINGGSVQLEGVKSDINVPYRDIKNQTNRSLHSRLGLEGASCDRGVPCRAVVADFDARDVLYEENP